MKRIISAALFFSLCVALFSCAMPPEPCDLSSGSYYVEGEYESKRETPYVSLNFENYSFHIKNGVANSEAERGTFTVRDGKIIATTQNTTFTFEIRDEKTVVLSQIGNEKYFGEHLGKAFKFGL